VSYRYAWVFIESLQYARLAWQEADSAGNSQDAVSKLAGYKLAAEDFECAATLVRPFQDARTSNEFTTTALQASAKLAAQAYVEFAVAALKLATALRAGVRLGVRLSLDEAADIRISTEKAGEGLIRAAKGVVFALLKPTPDPIPMDRWSLTRNQRAALSEGLKRRFPAALLTDPKGSLDKPETHSPDLAAALLHGYLTKSEAKAIDDP